MKFYTSKEACEILHIKKRTFYNYCKSGKIKSHIIARKVLIAHDDLQEFIEAQKRETFNQSQSQKESA